jgi:hypothetical protein
LGEDTWGDLELCTATVDWTPGALATYETGVASGDPTLVLMARTLDFVTTAAPAYVAGYGLIDRAADRCLMTTCLVQGGDKATTSTLIGTLCQLAPGDPLVKKAMADRSSYLNTAEEDGAGDLSAAGVALAGYGLGPRLMLCFRDQHEIGAIVVLCRRQSEPAFTDAEKQRLADARELLETVYLVAIRQAQANANG